MSPGDEAAFFAAVDAACKKAIWCAVATVERDQPRIRIVHPTDRDRSRAAAT